MAFLAVRLIVFASFWNASADKGAWTNFYNQAQPARFVLAGNFHDYCDWHPPLYYFLTSLILFFFKSQWVLYFFNIWLSFACLLIGYKVAKVFFSEKIAFFSVFLLAVEPFWAWHNWLLVSENLSTPLFLAFLYFLFKFLKVGSVKNIFYSGLFLGLTTLTRPNTLFLSVVISFFLLPLFLFRRKFDLTQISFKKLLVALLLFNLTFFVVLVPWLVRNKFVYDRFTLANILSTNIYHYNLPPLIAFKMGISYEKAYNIVIQYAKSELGENVGDQGDCAFYGKDELNKQFAFFKNESCQYILFNLPLYIKMHLIKAVPYFFQPGYMDMWSAYTGKSSKPDMTAGILNGDLSGFWNFLAEQNGEAVVYIFGIVFWIFCTMALIWACVYSYFKDRNKFVFFVISLGVASYSALLTSPFIMARYRLPIYLLFFIPLIYFFMVMKQKKIFKKIIRKIPFLAQAAKNIYDWLAQKKLKNRVTKFLSLSDLPFVKKAPDSYSIGYEPTIRCNLKCKMCYQGQTRILRQEELTKEQSMLIFEKIENKIKKIKLVGGEPLIRQDIFDLISFWNNRGKKIILQTNCTLINEKTIGKLSGFKGVCDILTSLDGEPKIHDAIRGAQGSFVKLEKAIGLIRQKMPQTSITVFATLLVWDNIDSLCGLIDTCQKLGLQTINILFEQVYAPEDEKNTRAVLKNVLGWQEDTYRLNTQIRYPLFPSDFNSEKMKSKLDKVKNYGFKKGCFVNFSPRSSYENLDKYLGEKSGKVFCLKILFPELRISQKGEVIWCDIIEKSFGNLLEKTPDEIWLSKDYQKFRRYLLNNSLPICKRCCKAIYL